MRDRKVIKFSPTYTAFTQCISLILMSAVPLSLIYVLGGGINRFNVIQAMIPFFIIAYVGIDKLFVKKLVLEDSKIVFYSGLLKYELDTEKFKVYYDKAWILGGQYKHQYGLFLYRDIDKIVGFSMNNKFLLTYEMDEVKLEYYQKEFKSKLGVEINIVKPIN